MVAVVRSPTACAVSTIDSHRSVVSLSGTQDGAHLVVEDLGRGAGQRAEAGIPQARQVVAHVEPEAGRAVMDFERREGVHVDVGHGVLRGLHDAEVGLAGVARMDAALHADFGRAALVGLAHPPGDLAMVEIVGRPAQAVAQLALGERAEPARERADVRVVDVAVDHVGHGRRRLSVRAACRPRHTPRRTRRRARQTAPRCRRRPAGGRRWRGATHRRRHERSGPARVPMGRVKRVLPSGPAPSRRRGRSPPRPGGESPACAARGRATARPAARIRDRSRAARPGISRPPRSRAAALRSPARALPD